MLDCLQDKSKMCEQNTSTPPYCIGGVFILVNLPEGNMSKRKKQDSLTVRKQLRISFFSLLSRSYVPLCMDQWLSGKDARLMNMLLTNGLVCCLLCSLQFMFSVYVRGPNDEDLSAFIEKVMFSLHPSFAVPVRGNMHSVRVSRVINVQKSLHLPSK